MNISVHFERFVVMPNVNVMLRLSGSFMFHRLHGNCVDAWKSQLME